MKLHVIMFLLTSTLTFAQNIKDLKSGEEVILSHSSHGCEPGFSDEIKFENRHTVLRAIYHGQIVWLSEEQITSITHFEKAIRGESTTVCTRTDVYEFIFKGTTEKISDSSCRRDGWYFLLNELGVKPAD